MGTKSLKFILLLFSVLISCSKDTENSTEIIEDENGNPIEVDTSVNKKSVGDSANDLLSSGSFEKLILEILYVGELNPTSTTLDNFKEFLEARLNKPKGIEIILRQIENVDQEFYSIQDIRNLEDTHRSKFNEKGTIEVSGIFIDGEYDQNTENGSVLGVAYRNTSFVIFEQTIREFSNQPLAPSLTTLETVVVNHEMGHLLGLVNAGTTMQTNHQDIEHGRHCTNENCLMFWTAETGEGLLNMLTGGSIPPLDALCISDLQANGGK
ncbi:membrane metalloprotease [Maribacter flavus]|uniref:Membrane metalloprotease n=1 Tax=Maribacter flavus TaxID=1658664 RepID=A0A5B2TRW5_9FLAO|nr:membrane metalloprotease [Maribacter flavus]KAA2216628.1 membrane metalloprotease [Maribacter flavus]